ncbi:MAG: fused MFS/spermidine synthase [Limisphaerales bacterium]
MRKSTPASERQRLVLIAVGALGVSCVMTQLALMRELLGAFSGNEMVLGVVLGLWLLLMGLGAWLGRTSDRLQHQLAALAVIQVLVAILPLVQIFLLRALRNVVFIRGSEVGVTETVGAAFVLLLPYCLVAGYGLTLACSILARAEGPAGIGHAYIADSIGSIIGGVLFSFVLVRFLDHIAILVCPALLNLLLAGLVGLRVQGSKSDVQGPKFFSTLLPALALVLTVGLIAAALLCDPDGLSTRLQYPRQHIVARASSPYGKLIVTEADGQFDFRENGIPITSTRDDQHVEETVHYAMAQRPEARRVLLVCGGISGTAREILKYGVKAVDYVELDPLILALGKRYLPENLADGRIRVINTDGRLFVKQTQERYEVVIVDVPAPSTAQLNRFYTAEFLAEVKRVLAKDGIVCFALGQYENYLSPELTRMLSSACLAAKQSFHNVLAIPGSRVFFLASDGPLFADIAARIEQFGIKTRLVNRHYLAAMLTPDRMADLAGAIVQPAAMNRDFSPILYYYHLRHWMSQFNVRFGLIQVVLLVLLCFYLVRLRGSAFVLFASGFAASALEVVLLLAFQVLCGSVYHQVGVIVTVFMAGLALGASLMNRSSSSRGPRQAVSPNSSSAAEAGGAVTSAPPSSEEAPPLPVYADGHGARGTERPTTPPPGQSTRQAAPIDFRFQISDFRFGGLSGLAWLIAAYALLLPLVLPLLNHLGGSVATLFLIKATIVLLTLTLAVLVGMQFPLANRLEFDGTIAGASRLYTADFVGAFLGALLACTLLIPLIGVGGVCLLTALLNVASGLAGRQTHATVTSLLR